MLFALMIACNGEIGEDSADLDLATSKESDAGLWTVSWSADPDPVPFNDSFTLTLDFDGPEVTDVVFDATMPNHGHGMQVQPTATIDATSATYEGMVLHMSGWWLMEASIESADGTDTVSFDFVCCE